MTEKKGKDCNCPHCQLRRGFDEMALGDFLAQARVAASRSFPAFKRMAESLYQDDWDQSQVSPGAFLMLVAAHLMHEATVAMAAESNRPADISAMLLGMKAFGLTFDFMLEMGEPVIGVIEAAPDNPGTMH